MLDLRMCLLVAVERGLRYRVCYSRHGRVLVRRRSRTHRAHLLGKVAWMEAARWELVDNLRTAAVLVG